MLQVPIALALDKTIEDPSAKTEADRIRVFGQSDHVRLYNAVDYVERLQSTGFSVSPINYAREIGEGATTKYALIPEEQIFICTKS